MSEIVQTMKLHIRTSKEDSVKLHEVTKMYQNGCNYVSDYVFEHGFNLSFLKLVDATYKTLRSEHHLKSQMAQSCVKTVIARYKTVKEQLFQNPYKYKDENDKWIYITRDLEWLTKPICFHRPQADLVRGRDYSFIVDKTTGEHLLTLNTLSGRIRVLYDLPEYFKKYFCSEWSFGTGKLVSLKGEWYFHIPMTKENAEIFSNNQIKHVVGIDRGLRFLATTYDETGKTTFYSGKEILAKRNSFQRVRDELQSRGTKSAKRVLKRISGRENRWMSDVNHRISKTLTDKYGKNTLFVIEDLTGVSFEETNLTTKTKEGRREIRSWTFYQLEQFLSYKTQKNASLTLKVNSAYTSQRCPKCGRIHKENRKHESHIYICDNCGYKSNDDRVGAMNIQLLGTLFVSGNSNPKFEVQKKN